MNIIACFLLVIYLSDTQGGGGGKGSKHDILKIHVPEIHKHQYHTHYVFIHHQEPKKAPKKKEVKHVHHKHIHLPAHKNHHWYTSHAHKHTTKHGHSVGKPVVEVHAKKPEPAHKAKGHKPAPKHKTPAKAHEHNAYPFSHEDVRYTSSPAYQGYQVTENFDPEVESQQEFNADDYSSPNDAYGPQNEGGYYTQGQQSSQGGGFYSGGQQFSSQGGVSPQTYHAQYFMNPVKHNGGQYGQYGHYVSPGVSSYDISPYHAQPTSQQHQHSSFQSDGNGNVNSDDGNTNNYDSEGYSQQVQSEDEGFRGDYDFDYEPNHFDGDSVGYNGVSHASRDYGENDPGYSHQHKTYVKNVKTGMVTRMHKFTTDDAGDSTPKTVGFRHTFTQKGHYKTPLPTQ